MDVRQLEARSRSSRLEAVAQDLAFAERFLTGKSPRAGDCGGYLSGERRNSLRPDGQRPRDASLLVEQVRHRRAKGAKWLPARALALEQDGEAQSELLHQPAVGSHIAVAHQDDRDAALFEFRLQLCQLG